MLFPVIKRISPQLARSRKCIRRTACNSLWTAFLINLKQFRIRPHIRTVKGNVNRHITYDLNSFFVGIGFQLFPLFFKKILLEAIKAHFL